MKDPFDYRLLNDMKTSALYITYNDGIDTLLSYVLLLPITLLYYCNLLSLLAFLYCKSCK